MRAPRTRSLVLLVGIALVATACGGSSSADKTSSAPAALTAPGHGNHGAMTSGASVEGGTPGTPTVATSNGATQAQTIGATVPPAAADIVENGTLVVRFRSAAGLRASYEAIGRLAAGDGGFVSSSTLDAGTAPTAAVTVRVPNDQVRGLVDQIGAMGKVTTQTLGGQDVTATVVDLAVEITNLTSEEAAVRQLLAKAGTVATILTVQQQLFQLQDEIQELTAQSNSLHDKIQYATVTVTLSTIATHSPARHHRPARTVSRFWHLATSHSVDLVRGLVLAVGWSAPGLVLLALGGGLVLVVRRRHFHGAAGAGRGSAVADD